MQAVYEYPPKLSRAERQVKAAHDIEEHRKMQRNMYKNILLGVVIIIIGAVFASAVFARSCLYCWGLAIVLWAGLCTGITHFHGTLTFIRGYMRITLNTLNAWGFTKSYLHICLYYEEVEKSYQTNKGRLVCVLKMWRSQALW